MDEMYNELGNKNYATAAEVSETDDNMLNLLMPNERGT